MRRLLISAAVLAALLCVAAGAWVLHFLSWTDAPLPIRQTYLFELPAGASLNGLAQQLAQDEVIRHDLYLRALGRLDGSARSLQAGEYAIDPGTTPRQLLTTLREGDVVQYTLRIPEGGTVRDLLIALALAPKLRHELENADAQSLAAELGLESAYAEGQFFPDTYSYRKGVTDLELLRLAHEAMRQQVDLVWSTRDPDGALSNRAELIILASIIEKESGVETDRAQISQVFHSRLKKGMRLQTDPTVIYALGTEFDGNLTRAHLRVDSPFNTYKYAGLPPAPIALPSAASLRAAAQPADGNFLYFVARGDGTSVFSETLDEHNQAVRRYQLRQAQP